MMSLSRLSRLSLCAAAVAVTATSALAVENRPENIAGLYRPVGTNGVCPRFRGSDHPVDLIVEADPASRSLTLSVWSCQGGYRRGAQPGCSKWSRIKLYRFYDHLPSRGLPIHESRNSCPHLSVESLVTPGRTEFKKGGRHVIYRNEVEVRRDEYCRGEPSIYSDIQQLEWADIADERHMPSGWFGVQKLPGQFIWVEGGKAPGELYCLMRKERDLVPNDPILSSPTAP